MFNEEADLVVIGGGPAGSTLATFVSMQGHRVLLLERGRMPLYKIGESLLPSTVHGICAMLGVGEELKQAGFTLKHGGTFRWGRNKEPWTFSFAQSSKIPGPTSYAYQVERMKFDPILFNNARRKGVDAREEHTAIAPIRDAGRVIGVTYVDDRGRQRNVRAKYVVDASGYQSTLHRSVGERIHSRFFRNVAIFGYYEGGERLPPPRSGNIFCAAFDSGWFWYIPLRPDLTSVGAVICQDQARGLKKSETEATLKSLIDSCEPIKYLLRSAHRITEGPYGEIRVRKDYSYSNTRFWVPGLALVGDAACFIDPVFSSGVHLASYSALLAARSLNTFLAGELSESRVFDEFERRYRREFSYFYDFLIAFYDFNKDQESYYWSARNVLNTAEIGNDAFIRLVAGVGGSAERLYDNDLPFPADHTGMAEAMFGHFGNNENRGNLPASGFDRSRFMSGFLAEVTQMQSQAVFKRLRSPEVPLFEDGLVPSRDGFHWCNPRDADA